MSGNIADGGGTLVSTLAVWKQRQRFAGGSHCFRGYFLNDHMLLTSLFFFLQILIFLDPFSAFFDLSAIAQRKAQLFYPVART
jgi:hypothetical protein